MNAESIFVSYSSKDRPFAVGLVKELQKLGANIWIDQLGIGLGENWDNAIEDALDNSETFMLILSPTSVESQNVQDEVSIAINTQKKFVPILIIECDLPMRWQRKQYADLVNNPEKAISDILQFLGIKDKASADLKKLLSLIGVSEAPLKNVQKINTDKTEKEQHNEINLKDLLVSEEEIDCASVMHKRGIKKNWQLIIFVALSSVALLTSLYVFFGQTQSLWLTIIGFLLLNLLAIKPYGSIAKRSKNMELMDLLKLKRNRLIRVMNKLSKKEIESFNSEFNNYITV